MAKKKLTPDEERAAKFDDLIKRIDNKHYPVRQGWTGGIPWCVPTGLPSVDIISGRDNDGIYGIPGGSMITFLGEPSQGKSTLSLSLLANAQRPDPKDRRPMMLAYLIETEGGLLTREYMERQGVDVDHMLYDIPNTLEEAFEGIRVKLSAIRRLPEADRVPMFILLDSISNLQTEEEDDMAFRTDKEGKIPKGSKMAHARINSEKIRQLTPLIRQTNSIVAVVAQAKAKISFGWTARKNYEEQTFIGNRPIMYYSSLLYNVTRGAAIKNENGDHTGMVVNIRVDKSKVGVPYGKARDLELYYDRGFDRRVSLHDALVAKSLVATGAGKNANLFTFQLRLRGSETISYRTREGIRELSEGEIVTMQQALYLSNEKVAKLRLEASGE